MPNIKIYVDETVLAENKLALTNALTPLRDIIMKYLNVPQSACQMAIISCIGYTEHPAINFEIYIMPQPDRTQENIKAMGAEIQKLLNNLTQQTTAFRCAQLDPTTYVAMK